MSQKADSEEQRNIKAARSRHRLLAYSLAASALLGVAIAVSPRYADYNPIAYGLAAAIFMSAVSLAFWWFLSPNSAFMRAQRRNAAVLTEIVGPPAEFVVIKSAPEFASVLGRVLEDPTVWIPFGAVLAAGPRGLAIGRGARRSAPPIVISAARVAGLLVGLPGGRRSGEVSPAWPKLELRLRRPDGEIETAQLQLHTRLPGVNDLVMDERELRDTIAALQRALGR